MRRSFILSLLTSLLCVKVSSENFVYLYEWIEDFKSPNVLKYWYNDEVDIWRQAKQSDVTEIININDSNNLLALQLDSSLSKALYFQTSIRNNTENAKLSIFITVLGCNSIIQLYWRGRIVLEGPRKCPENIWIPLEYSTFLTEFELLDLFLLVTGPLQTDSLPLLLISRLDVVLQLSRDHANHANMPVLTTQDYDQELKNEFNNSSSYLRSNVVITIISWLLLRILIYNFIT